MRKNVLILTAAALVLGMALPAQAQMAERWQEVLDLSEQQVTQLRELHQQHQETRAAARAELIKARAGLRALQAAPERDVAALEQAIRKVSELRTEQQVRALKQREESLKVLTEEQRTKLQTLRRTGRGRALGTPEGRGTQGMRGVPGRGLSGRGMQGMRMPGMRTHRRCPGSWGPGSRRAPGRGYHTPGTGRGMVPPPPPEK
ncbi:MAG: Spy/CpxP family protein refolding chaperone [bacterium]